MSQEKQYILAVPNFSDGRREDVIEAVTGELKGIEGVKLVSVEPEHDFNRTVVTVIGEPAPLKEALIKMASKSIELIDMREQSGTHPRIGAQDTIPLFPLMNATVEECVKLADEIGKELHEKTGVPIFYAADNATTEDRKALAFIRKGQYEGLRDLLKEIKDDASRKDEYESRKPDLSTDGLLSDKSGATICSAEAEGLTAYNVFLNTEDVDIAKKIAKAVRGPSGGFSTTRAVGIKFPEYQGVVVSVNMFDCENTPVYRVFELVKQEAARYGIAVTGSELVGPIKLAYVVNSLEYYLGLQGFRIDQILETHLYD
ncbi:bifunctional glutamate formiminotransferase/formimidoyltetrahydrofolate cyclodeaminase FtcD [Gottschalkia acidurici 9a]|uniref:glutamate formimidoyltransferase n=1 Tax=Gottschalkia acidurici (strain ATCC 7906 / DSM 604 / BCRC 14475 / CIP 104303 / KCTC 5404 / NCIMB 10678 / 9a) TaxID=1128398 RepID=K0AYC9_GOTA9|nr:glutamate formimidoyltransferase [Gottschalkia acidurici]AFS77381.1 bifunctional glutamate formiminotransferase/formimidoyltetrahydrofolate cyclodeaminase FtcD [Gottschalkia acidurici 9a]